MGAEAEVSVGVFEDQVGKIDEVINTRLRVDFTLQELKLLKGVSVGIKDSGITRKINLYTHSSILTRQSHGWSLVGYGPWGNYEVRHTAE